MTEVPRDYKVARVSEAERDGGMYWQEGVGARIA